MYNFFVMPLVPGVTVSHKELDGVICPDITSVYTSGEDYQRRYYGAAEFQLVTGPQDDATGTGSGISRSAEPQ